MGYFFYDERIPRKKVDGIISSSCADFSFAVDYNYFYVGIADISFAESSQIIGEALSPLGIMLVGRYVILENTENSFFGYKIPLKDLSTEKIIALLKSV